MLPRVAVIIASFNGREYLPDCLSSLQAVDYPKDRWSIIVVDNASSDNTVEYLTQHFPGVHCMVQKTNIGFAAANNIGLRYALENGYDFAFLLNQDTVVTSAFLREAVAVAGVDPTVAAVQSKLLRHGTNEINSWGNAIHFLGFGYAGGNRQPDRPLSVSEIAYPSGAAVLVRCSALKIVGLMDEAFFMYHEDLDLGWRLWLAGFRCLLAPASVVYHKYEFSRSVKKFYWMERNRIRVLLTHYRWRTLALLIPTVLLADAGLLTLSLRHGFWRQLLAAHAYFFQPATWPPLWRRRREVQRLRKRSDREIIVRFTGRIDFQEMPLRGLVKIANVVLDAYWQLVKRLIWW